MERTNLNLIKYLFFFFFFNIKKAPEKVNESPNLDSKSWFQRWNFKQENINNSPNDQEKEKEFNYYISDRPLNSVKADLIHAFLSVSVVFFSSQLF